MNYTLEEFWKKRLSAKQLTPLSQLRGWHTSPPELPSFMEAPLTLCGEFGSNAAPETSPLILVSAPGAVGKSTLARQVAAVTGATYVDLAVAEPVGGNTLSGGLVKSGIYNAWQDGAAAVLIDGLDEARLKVTQEAFEAFLRDVADVSRGRSTPTVLFGRTGAIQDAWLVLEEKLPLAVLEIGYYGPEAALEFACARLKALDPPYPHLQTGYSALEILLDRLRNDTDGDGDRFAGYAPVLQAVTDRVAREANPSALISQVEAGEQPVTLQTVVTAILEREQQKLGGLALENQKLLSELYSPNEQLDRLVARVFRGAAPSLPRMAPKDAQAYSTALETWVPEHPFLDGGANTASAVFEAVIAAAALRDHSTMSASLAKELAKGASANPFLSEFYLTAMRGRPLPPEHIGIIYSSLRARLSLGDEASLSLEGRDSDDEMEGFQMNVEVALSRGGKNHSKILSFDSDQIGVTKLGSHIEDVEIIAPHATIELGGALETVLVAPISIQCSKITLATERLILEPQAGQKKGVIFLEAEVCESSAIAGMPVLNGEVELSVSWPGVTSYPWTSFATLATAVGDDRIDEALRRFRKFVISFRSHSKGSLKRLAAKIEHERMTKGTGQAVLDHMIAKGILTKSDSMYTLHAEKLAIETEASYTSSVSRVFSQKTIQFVGEAIAPY